MSPQKTAWGPYGVRERRGASFQDPNLNKEDTALYRAPVRKERKKAPL